MNGIYNKTWRDLYVSTKVFAKINAISFKQARKVRDVMLNLYILLAALVWKTLTFKSDNHRREFPSRFSNRHNFWAISIVFYSPDFILMIKEGINTSPHSNTPNFHTFVRSTGNQVCVTRTKKQRSAPRMHGHSMCQPSRHVVGHRSWQSHHPKQLQGSVTPGKNSRSEWAYHDLLAHAEVSQLWYQKYWWFHLWLYWPETSYQDNMQY